MVTGIRGSLRESLETKREAVGVVDALNAEDVGKFPDKNLAEALQRVPGIVISRDFGEGERVNLRGLSSTLTRTLLNGHSLATADWFILDQLNTTRSFNYLMLPADVIGQVEGLQVAAGGLRRGRHRRHDRRHHAQAARHGFDADLPVRTDGLHGSCGRIRSAVLGPVQLEERRRARSAR